MGRFFTSLKTTPTPLVLPSRPPFSQSLYWYFQRSGNGYLTGEKSLDLVKFSICFGLGQIFDLLWTWSKIRKSTLDLVKIFMKIFFYGFYDL